MRSTLKSTKLRFGFVSVLFVRISFPTVQWSDRNSKLADAARVHRGRGCSEVGPAQSAGSGVQARLEPCDAASGSSDSLMNHGDIVQEKSGSGRDVCVKRACCGPSLPLFAASAAKCFFCLVLLLRSRWCLCGLWLVSPLHRLFTAGLAHLHLHVFDTLQCSQTSLAKQNGRPRSGAGR